MTSDTDPVGNKFVASLARPGGNITDCPAPARTEWQTIELLKEIVAKLSRVLSLHFNYRDDRPNIERAGTRCNYA